jgi:uncharacterized delta-60 repeat protein
MRKTIVLGVVLLLIQIPLIALVLVQEITWGGPDADLASDVAVASDGSVYLTGVTRSFGRGDEDAFLLKFAPNGSLVWQRTYGTAADLTSSGSESGQGVAVAADGSVYVTGNYRDGNVFLVKFNASGVLQWQRTWGDNGNGAGGVAVGADGSVYVAGVTFTFDPGGQGDVFLLKFSADGRLQWQRTWGGTGFDVGHDVAIGSDGGIYVAGDTNSFFANDAFLVKFSPEGAVLWERDWAIFAQDGVTAGLTDVFGVGTAADGSVYVTGNSTAAGFLENIVLVKFDATGAVVWERVGGPGFGTGIDVAVGSDGNVHVTGNLLLESAGCCGSAAFVWTFLSDGKTAGAAIWKGSDLERASGQSIAVAPGGTLVVAGSAEAPPYTFDRAGKNAKAPNALLVTPVGTVTTPPGRVTRASGVVNTPAGSLVFAGATDAALLRMQP